ncbi:MAG: glycosyltransferase [Bacteroidales bacterium]|nr:glycosyltransferase [Bacteroidales bacterium]
MYYSIILPTFGRPEEVTAFLGSLTKQLFKNFEVIVVDGSPDTSLQELVNGYKDKLTLSYFYKKSLGASESRNLGCEHAKGEWLVFIDSDCILPPHYMDVVDSFLVSHTEIVGYGGPDAADDNFSPFQKAVNYAMTSMLTTGGIRGKKFHLGKFHMRGFNMGMRREVFFNVGGFSGMQVAEDLDLSMRLQKAGYKTSLIPDAFVYHRRKANFRIFWHQLYFHGKGRIDLHLKHGNALKALHLLPSMFMISILSAIVAIWFVPWWFYLVLSGVAVYTLAVFADSSIQNKSIWVGLLSVVTSLELLIAYGLGVLRNIIYRMVFKRGGESKKATELKK